MVDSALSTKLGQRSRESWQHRISNKQFAYSHFPGAPRFAWTAVNQMSPGASLITFKIAASVKVSGLMSVIFIACQRLVFINQGEHTVADAIGIARTWG